jgi:hypothetical protein
MRKFKSGGLISIFFFFSTGSLFSQVFDIEYSDNRHTLTIQSGLVGIKSEWITPSVNQSVFKGDWTHVSSSVIYNELAGIPGNRTSDIFNNKNIEVERQVWISTDKRVVALRQLLTNKGKNPFTLRSMTPLACKSNEAFMLKGNPAPENWIINIQKRHKNDFPESIRPESNTSILADPCFAIPLATDTDGQCLLIGYLDWTKHLAGFNLSFRDENGKTLVNGLYSICEFNDVEVPPDGTRTTQWIYITAGKNFNAALDEYAERVAKYHNVQKPPENAPSVYCSWYWYGLNYTEELFLRDLQALKKLRNRKPFDVFLIDESWELNLWGDFAPNDRFPGGMKSAADKIKEMGYIPGIWTPPYLVSPTSQLFKKHPEWVLRSSKGEYYTFRMNEKEHLVLDPTYPGVTEYLEESFRKLSNDWGFKYFKFDFMRAVFLEGDYKFYNPCINRLEAYRMGLEAIRRGVGDEAYISVCGGHYGGSLGIANSQRSGSDVVSIWQSKEIPKYKQNILRTWMSRLWHVDPDAMMVRRNEVREFTNLSPDLSLGLFTDNEARVNALNQYIGGGLVSFTENYLTLGEDRLELYKHVIPSVNSSSFPLDWYDLIIPSMTVTQIDPVCRDLENWNTLAVINWTDQKKPFAFQMDDQVLKSLKGDQFLLFEFFSQEVMGIYKKNNKIGLTEMEPHSGILLKIIPWDGTKPVLAGTDLHFSMGGVEIREWNYDAGSVEGLLDTEWHYPINITAVFPDGIDRFKTKRIKTDPGQKKFWIEVDE